MCQYFANAAPILYESRTRTLRLHNLVTSLRLENLIWDTLAETAAGQGLSTNALIQLLHDDVIEHRGEVPNFASFLRVTCLRHLQRKLELAREGSARSVVHLAHPAPAAHQTHASPPIPPRLATHVAPRVPSQTPTTWPRLFTR